MKTENVRTENTLVPVIVEAERTIREIIKHFGLKTEPKQILVTVQTKGRKQALGWFWAKRWSAGKAADASKPRSDAAKDAVHEINLSAEHLKTCDVGELLIHEMAHAENNTLEIRDCVGRMHNKKFKVMAERLGLLVKPRDRSVGFGYTELDAPAKTFLKDIKFDKEIFSMARLTPSPSMKAGTHLLKCECPGCGYVVRTTQKWLDTGVPTCPCGEEMGVA